MITPEQNTKESIGRSFERHRRIKSNWSEHISYAGQFEYRFEDAYMIAFEAAKRREK